MPQFNYATNATADVPDLRDYIYQPSLNQMDAAKSPQWDLVIRDQGREGACTGFSLCAVINYLNQERRVDLEVSARMLYEMARKNDEWPGEEYDGSSLRGAIKGWKNMGVCSEEEWPYKTRGGLDYLTISAARDARKNTIASYYRLLPEIAHFHSAINESGIVAVSARVHKGWQNPREGVIEKSDDMIGGHAFAVVGYNEGGFIVQNSWGKKWGDNGLALWSYEDWVENVMDAWVISLAIPTPQIFGKEAVSYRGFQSGGDTDGDGKSAFSRAVDRVEIAGHFVHIDDGKYHDSGRYWSNAADVEQTAKLVADSKDYQHLLFYFHGGLNAPKASAKRIRAMKDGFKRNGVYPFHVMYDTGLAEELMDLIRRKGKASSERVGGVSDWTDRFLEGILRKPGTLIWDEMKRDAHAAFDSGSAGLNALNHFIKHLRYAPSTRKKKIHIAGHSTGAIVIAHLLRALQNRKIEIASCSLLAPAASVDLFDSHYGPIYRNKKKLRLKKLNIYSLKDHVERDDNVAAIYRKSLLYLVSNSFEHGGRETPISGLENFLKHVHVENKKPQVYYSNGRTGSYTRSRSHGGFDNDLTTMNHVLKTVLGRVPKSKFTKEELDY